MAKLGATAPSSFGIMEVGDHAFRKEGSGTLNRKCSIVIAYLLLEAESDRTHPISQQKLAEFATHVGCPCDRKTIGRDLRALAEMGCPIVKTARGFYIGGKCFTPEEVTFITNAVKDAPNPAGFDVTRILSRLMQLLRHSYRGRK